QEKVLEIFQARANPELPGDFTPEQIAAASIPADLRKQLVAALAQGAVFTEEQLVGMLGPELGRQTYLASTIGVEGILEVEEIVAGLGQAPADATTDEKQVYALDLSILVEFLQGQLNGKTTLYRQNLGLLTDHVNQF